MKIKVSEATGPVLDWMVARCEGALAPVGNLHFVGRQLFIGVGGDLGPLGKWVLYSPSTDWSQGGPIIEREHMQITHGEGTGWGAYIWKGENFADWGPTLLIAAMRCFVTSKLGEEVEVPEGLT